MRFFSLCVVWCAVTACGSEPREPVRIAGKPVVVSVALPRSVAAADHFQVRLNALQSTSDGAVILRVFADAPEANRDTSVDDPRFLGYVTILPGANPKKAPVNTVLSVESQRRSGKGPQMQVTIVPMNDTPVQVGSIQAGPSK